MEKTDLVFWTLRKRRWVTVAMLGVFFLYGITLISGKVKPSRETVYAPHTTISVGTTTIAVLVADTNALRARGLSGRKALGENEGMLFVFEKPDRYGFWMKEMNFPIDIIWIGEDMRVRGITEHISPDTYPEVFYPPTPIQFVLETQAGFAQSHGIQNGDLLKVYK